MGRATLNWGGVKRSSFNFNYKVNFKDLCNKLLCVLSNERFKTYQMESSFCHLSYALGVVLWGAGCPGGQKLFHFKHGHVAYQIDGDVEQNRMQVKNLSYGQTGDLGVRSKGQISLNFDYHVNSKIFIPNFVCVLTNKR